VHETVKRRNLYSDAWTYSHRFSLAYCRYISRSVVHMHKKLRMCTSVHS